MYILIIVIILFVAFTYFMLNREKKEKNLKEIIEKKGVDVAMNEAEDNMQVLEAIIND